MNKVDSGIYIMDPDSKGLRRIGKIDGFFKPCKEEKDDIKKVLEEVTFDTNLAISFEIETTFQKCIKAFGLHDAILLLFEGKLYVIND